MPVSYKNNWKNIGDKLRNIFRSEFGASIPVYIGEGDYADQQFIKIIPTGNEILEKQGTGEIKEYTFNLFLYIAKTNSNKNNINKLYRIMSRAESLIASNRNMTLADSTQTIDSIMLSYEITEVDEVYDYIVEMDYSCIHFDNM
mgnify:CR=1 FL=1|tara:strand:+ start:83 stop:514 length:432 start_codon:yes stop_codon:yes gene_type:complete